MPHEYDQINIICPQYDTSVPEQVSDVIKNKRTHRETERHTDLKKERHRESERESQKHR